MTIAAVEVTAVCDGCGVSFEVSMDTGLRSKRLLWEFAEDAIRDAPSTSVQGGMHLCGACTATVDASADDEADLTHEQVVAALDAAHALQG